MHFEKDLSNEYVAYIQQGMNLGYGNMGRETSAVLAHMVAEKALSRLLPREVDSATFTTFTTPGLAVNA